MAAGERQSAKSYVKGLLDRLVSGSNEAPKQDPPESPAAVAGAVDMRISLIDLRRKISFASLTGRTAVKRAKDEANLQA